MKSLPLLFAVASWLMPLRHASGHDFHRQLFEGKLVGVFYMFHAEANREVLNLQFLMREGFSMTAHPDQFSPQIFLTAMAGKELDFDTLTEHNFMEQVRAALPDGIQMGQECLVEVEWIDATHRITSIVPATDHSRRKFIIDNLEYLSSYQAYLVDISLSSYHQGVAAMKSSLARFDQQLQAEDLPEAQRPQIELYRQNVGDRIESAIFSCRLRLSNALKDSTRIMELAPEQSDTSAIRLLIQKIQAALSDLPVQEQK